MGVTALLRKCRCRKFCKRSRLQRGQQRWCYYPLVNARIKVKTGLPTGKNSKHTIVKVTFGPGPNGMELTSRESSGKSSKGNDSVVQNNERWFSSPAERCKLQPSMILHACNDEIVNNYAFEDIMKCLRQASRPMVLKFLHDPDMKLTRESGPIGLRLGNSKTTSSSRVL